MFYVRSYFIEDGAEVMLDEGPFFDRYLAELVLTDIGVDGSIPRGLGRVRVHRARIISEPRIFEWVEDAA